MKRGDQLKLLREIWDRSTQEHKEELVMATAMMVVADLTGEVSSRSVFSWARAEGISAPDVDEPEDVDLDEELDYIDQGW